VQRLLESGTRSPEEIIEDLERQNERLREDVSHLKAALEDARTASKTVMRAQANLRSQLEPLFKALRAVFGELDAAAIRTTSSGSDADPRASTVWESWKQRLGGGTAKVIDALLLHKEMNTTQLSIATGLHRTTIPALIFKLNKASLINKNGGKFSLKEL